ncbi:hypothetical protein V2J09_012289 [Rumex salicifolius]
MKKWVLPQSNDYIDQVQVQATTGLEERAARVECLHCRPKIKNGRVHVLQGSERCDFQGGRRLRFLPEAFGKSRGLVVLNLSNKQLQLFYLSILSSYLITSDVCGPSRGQIANNY